MTQIPVSETAATARPVTEIVDAVETLEGGGFLVHRPFPTATLDMIDPFLLLDEMGPIDVAPGEALGAPDHPHRGFETVTYMLDGEVEHRDSAGNHGVIGTGDVQWMTAGSGVVHSEMPGARMQRDGGKSHGLQLWVNLPRAAKMTPPRYQDLRAADIPTVAREGITAKVIAGEALGVVGPANTHVPILYVHAHVDAGATLELDVPSDMNAFAYVLAG
jgi:quercetin 2,3-dioxygenase